MLSRRRIWLWLAITLCAVVALAGRPRPSAAQTFPAAFPEETSLLPWNTVKDASTVALNGSQLVWIDHGDTLSTLDILTRQTRRIGAVGKLSSDLSARGNFAVWYEADRPWPSPPPPSPIAYQLRGFDLRNGNSFTVNQGYEDITAHLLAADRVIWGRRVGQNTQILQRRLRPEEQPSLLAEVSGAWVKQLSLSGPDLTWVAVRETAPQSGKFTSEIGTLNAETGGAPTTLVQIDGAVVDYARDPGALVWTERPNQDAADRSGRLLMLDPQGQPALLDTGVGAFRRLGSLVVAATSKGVVSYDLLSGARTSISATDPGILAVDDDTICWEAGSRVTLLHCHSRSQPGTIELRPPASITISMQLVDKMLVLFTKTAGPRDPVTVYAAPLADLRQRVRDDAAFNRLWERFDLPVSEGAATRSWTWGPTPIGIERREAYAEGPGGSRLVRYYDKSRMEINDPGADPNGPWYVTNGLLPVELITGRMQTGNQSYEQRLPAVISAVGDPGQFPTYADLASLYNAPSTSGPAEQGRPVTRLLYPDGSLGALNDYAADPATTLAASGAGVGVLQAFRDFMGQRGQLWQDGRAVIGQVYDPLFVFGIPVTAPCWVRVKVGGVERPILFQVFERRVLTYNPANPPGFRVEMGNVGRHYYQWRYP